MSEHQHNPDAQAIIAAVERLVQPTPIQIEQDEEGRPRVVKIVAVPKGLELKSLKPFEDERRERPERAEGTSQHTTLDSFCTAVERFSDQDSALFAHDDPKAPALLAVFDYHESHAKDDDGVVVARGAPRFGKHRARYAFPVSEEWRAWTTLPPSITQRDLAEFLQDHVADVLDPAKVPEGTLELAAQHGITLASPSQLLTLARGLAIRVESKIVSATNLSTGEAQLVYEEIHKGADNAPIKLPNGFAISIPVFRDGTRYVLLLRLSYRIQGGAPTFKAALHRAEQAFRDAFVEACQSARDRTGVPLFYGTPEG